MIFYFVLMRTKSGSQRYGKKETWAGLEKEFAKRTDLNGEFDYSSLADFYLELKKFTSSYIRAVDHNSELWGQKPYSLADCRDERTYLFALQIGGAKQILPVYMALSHMVEEQQSSRDVIRNFLKNFNYIWLRIFMLKTLIPNAQSFIQPNQIYGKMTGKQSWIRQIWDAKLSDDDHVKRIEELPLEMLKDVDISELDRKIPWEINNELWKELNIDGQKNSKQIKQLLVSVERALEYGENPQMTQLHGPGAEYVEHILPLQPQNWGEGGTKMERRQSIIRSTNICSETIVCWKIHLIPQLKTPPMEKIKAIKSSKFATARLVAEIIRKSGGWGENEISKWSTQMMNSLIEFYDY